MQPCSWPKKNTILNSRAANFNLYRSKTIQISHAAAASSVMRLLLLVSLLGGARAYMLQSLHAPPLATISRASSSSVMCADQLKTGTCKWFNAVKGFGFITADAPLDEEGTVDIFVHQSVIKATGFRSLADGETVEFNVGQERLTQLSFSFCPDPIFFSMRDTPDYFSTLRRKLRGSSGLRMSQGRAVQRCRGGRRMKTAS